MNSLKSLFLNNRPLLDLRAPIEFAKGAFPNATNIPLLSDEERELIGTCYKQKGQDKAVELGHQIVSGENKTKKLNAWINYFQINPEAHLYCFRGGMRSHLVQEWLKAEGIDVPLIEGGYKSLRSYLMDVLENPPSMIRVSGQTGVGKTEVLLHLKHAVDLEGLANHRGSAFGKYVSVQPSQINFENELAIEVMKQASQTIIVEDESHYIGCINIPYQFAQQMQESEVVILTCPKDERVHRIYKDYVLKQKLDFIKRHPKNGAQLFDESLISALQKIQKRLGGVRFQSLNELMVNALRLESESLHKQWISDILEFYYDPMYHYQIEKKKDKIIFTGNKQEIQNFIADKYS